jgi:hypothetical protein
MLMFVKVITSSSWKLFGRDEVIPTPGISGQSGNCVEISVQHWYLFGIDMGSRNMNRTVPCPGEDGVPGSWTTSDEGISMD